MNQPSELDKAYLAGFIDGEGTVTAVFRLTASSRREAVHCRLSIPNTSLEILEWIQERFGGVMHYKNSLPKKANFKKVYSLYWGGEKCYPVLRDVLPYLKIKHRQAEILLELSALVIPREGGLRRKGVTPWLHVKRGELVIELKSLNLRGVPVAEGIH